jgi:DnaJ-domain-containing protein 1
MPLLLLAGGVLLFLYLAAQNTGRLNTDRQRWTATLALLAAVLMLVRGELVLAIASGAFGLYALTQASPYWRRLFAADADGETAGRREHAQRNAGARRGFDPPRGTKMTEQEAYEVLGIQPGASAQDIGRAHRALMKKFHPDQGGTTYLAARVNEAKDVLLRRHR